MEDYRNIELEKQLKEKFPDLKVTVQQIATGNSAAKIKAEGTNTEADIVLGMETASIEQICDSLADLSTIDVSTDRYLPGVNGADSHYLIWEKFEGAFIVNTDVLAEKGLPEPHSYEDLCNPIYKNQIIMPNPKTSSTGYMFLNQWYNDMGPQEAMSYVGRMQVNIRQFTQSGSGPIKVLNQGEAAIGLGMVFQAAEQITKGAPLKIIAPAEGTPYNTTSFGIIKGRETNPDVQAVFRFLNEEFSPYDKAYFSPGKILKDQELKLPNYPADLPSGNMSTIADSALKMELLDGWYYS